MYAHNEVLNYIKMNALQKRTQRVTQPLQHQQIEQTNIVTKKEKNIH